MREQLLTSKSEHWCTPESFLELVRQLDTIGLDPCPNFFSTVNAVTEIDMVSSDGLAESWQGQGLVFVNPPYGTKLKRWVAKITKEAKEGAEIIALTPARTDTQFFHDLIIPSAQAILFWKGRITFVDGITGKATNPATFPSLVSYWGPRVDLFNTIFQDKGLLINL